MAAQLNASRSFNATQLSAGSESSCPSGKSVTRGPSDLCALLGRRNPNAVTQMPAGFEKQAFFFLTGKAFAGFPGAGPHPPRKALKPVTCREVLWALEGVLEEKAISNVGATKDQPMPRRV